MNYYEINFFGENDERDYSYYLKNKSPLTREEIENILIIDNHTEEIKNAIIGCREMNCLEIINNISYIQEIPAEEFVRCCDIEA